MAAVWDMLLILGLIMAQGMLVAGQVAVLAARRSRLMDQADRGDLAARVALDLARAPGRFLPGIGLLVTFSATLAAVYGGARLVDRIAERLGQCPWALVQHYAAELAMAMVVVGIALASLLLGDCLPKRLALRCAEPLALVLAVPLQWLGWLVRPISRMLQPGEATILVPGGKRPSEASALLEDIEQLIKLGNVEGLLEPLEQMAARKALHLGDRRVRDLMRPRIEIDAMDVNTPPDEVIGTVAMAGFSRLPVYEGDLDHILGFVYTKDLLRQLHLGWPIDLRRLVRPALLVPETLRIDRLLEMFRQNRTRIAIVLDEFGGTEGLISLDDVLEDLLGQIHEEQRLDQQQQIVRRDESSWLVDGGVNLDELLDRMGLEPARTGVPRAFATVAGLILFALGKIPRVGDRVVWRGLTWEVVDMDGVRIDRVLVSPAEKPAS